MISSFPNILSIYLSKFNGLFDFSIILLVGIWNNSNLGDFSSPKSLTIYPVSPNLILIFNCFCLAKIFHSIFLLTRLYHWQDNLSTIIFLPPHPYLFI
nr:MAG TPA: hypothetical protein [Caudoviricetes sp.]